MSQVQHYIDLEKKFTSGSKPLATVSESGCGKSSFLRTRCVGISATHVTSDMTITYILLSSPPLK